MIEKTFFEFIAQDSDKFQNRIILKNNILNFPKKGKKFKSYGDLSFLNSYNPLTNLKWNEKDKIWMNHKLYTEKFEKLYPDLIPQEKIE